MHLLHGDCLELMKNIEDQSVDFICTDPPYVLELHGGGKNEYSNRKLADCHIDYVSSGFDYDDVFHQFERISKTVNIIIFCSNKQISTIMQWWEQKKYSVTLLCWKKTNPIPFANKKYVSDLEFFIYVRGKGAYFNNDIDFKSKSKVYVAPSVHHKNRLHDCEKPLKLIKHLLLMHSKENDNVLDCFMGSGTCGVACKEMNRNFIGMEKKLEFFNIAKNRINNHHWQTNLLGE